MVRISVYSAGCDRHFADEFYLHEGIRSALRFAEQVVVCHDPLAGKDDGTTDALLKLKEVHREIVIVPNRWEPRMHSHMYALQKTLALSRCDGDVCVLMDADEVFHEDDAPKIRALAERLVRERFPAAEFRALHFWRDFDHVLQTGYARKVYMVRNGLGIFHGKHPDPESDEADAHVAFNHRPLLPVLAAPPPDVPTVYHYGHVRSPGVYLRKKNRIERMHHPDWVDLTSWVFDMKNAFPFDGNHPMVMRERIESFRRRMPF